jgi:hypothetical protein
MPKHPSCLDHYLPLEPTPKYICSPVKKHCQKFLCVFGRRTLNKVRFTPQCRMGGGLKGFEMFICRKLIFLVVL